MDAFSKIAILVSLVVSAAALASLHASIDELQTAVDALVAAF